jgi:predicted GTPase
MGAAGRDFHNFNMYFRKNRSYEVVAFTATQIPNIEKRTYPPQLSGRLYPNGIPIVSEKKLKELILKHDIDEVVFSYSDVSHDYVMEKASQVLANGADFRLLGPEETQLKSSKPIIAVCATRTGAGKSPTSRRIAKILHKMGKRVVVIRHPMPYGILKEKILERYVKHTDLDKYNCTIEEREEYEPMIDAGVVVYAGVDYEKILKRAEKEADIILWDGGNNDFPFVKPDLLIVMTDARRAGDELTHYPGSSNLRMADIIIINKVDVATPKQVQLVEKNAKSANSRAKILKARLSLIVRNKKMIKGKRVLAVEDGPTLTHGDLATGAAYAAAKQAGAKIVDPRPYAVGSIKKVFKEFKHLTRVLPTMGYGKKQIRELEKSINNTKCDAVVIGTPIDLRRFMHIEKPSIRVKYDTVEVGNWRLEDVVRNFVNRKGKKIVKKKKD